MLLSSSSAAAGSMLLSRRIAAAPSSTLHWAKPPPPSPCNKNAPRIRLPTPRLTPFTPFTTRCTPPTTTPTPPATPLLSTTTLHPAPQPDGAARLPFYSHYPLLRNPEWRANPSKLHELYTDPRAALLLLSKDKCLMTPGAAGEADWKLLLLRPAATAHTLLVQHAPADPAAPPASSTPTSPSETTTTSNGSSTATSPKSPAPEGATQAAMRRSIFLGTDTSGTPFFALDVEDTAAAACLTRAAAYLNPPGPNLTPSPSDPAPGPGPVEWKAARGLDLSLEEGALAATAVGLNQWHRVAAFKSSSGEALEHFNGGFARRSVGSSSGRGSVWPRIDPAVIMLTTAGAQEEWCLLGRKPEWPEGRYSTLAGFVEVGEPLELTVAREVEEESAVPVALPSVRYVVSQPWPFPRSLMIGFYCQAQVKDKGARGYDLLGTQGRMAAIDVGLSQGEVEQALLPALPEPHPQEDEMADVRWFHRDFVAAAIAAASSSGSLGSIRLQGACGFQIPGRQSLAHRLILGWLGGGSSADVRPALEVQDVEDVLNARGGRAGSEEQLLDLVPQVSLDVGVFKYVLIRLTDSSTGNSKLLVWGDTRAGYHMNVFQAAKSFSHALPGGAASLSLQPLGGGRIEHQPEQRRCSIFGYSSAFGPAPHEVAAALVRRWHPFTTVTTSYEGY